MAKRPTASATPPDGVDLERLRNFEEIARAIGEMNAERARMRARWAQEEAQREADKAAQKAEEERLFWARFNGDFTGQEHLLVDHADPRPGDDDPALARAQRFAVEHADDLRAFWGKTRR